MILLLFSFFSVLAILAALFVIFHTNPMASALFLVLCMVSLAALFLLFAAQFVAAIQIIVYAGAVLVLFIFVLMLISLERSEALVAGRYVQTILSGLGATLLLYVLSIALWTGIEISSPAEETTMMWDGQDETALIADLLFHKYLYPFELLSVLLLVAVVGALIIAQGEKR